MNLRNNPPPTPPPKGKDLYIEIQTDFNGVRWKYMVINLNKSLYWQPEAPQMLRGNLKMLLGEILFKKSDAKMCLFIYKKPIWIVYVEIHSINFCNRKVFLIYFTSIFIMLTPLKILLPHKEIHFMHTLYMYIIISITIFCTIIIDKYIF